MKGLFLRIIVAVGLMLWAIDMVFPWQRIMQSEENRYSAIQARSQLIVGTINNPISYFIGTEGESGLEYELAKNFADYLGVTLKMETFDSHDELFSALSSNQIDVAAANLLYLPKRADLFQVGPAYTSASWQLVYRKKENRPRNLSEITKPIFIAENAELNQFLAEAYKTYSNLIWRTDKRATQEELLLQVADGKIDYTIANSIDVSAAQQIRPELAIAFDVSDEVGVHWYLPSNSYNELQAALLDFMNRSI